MSYLPLNAKSTSNTGLSNRDVFDAALIECLSTCTITMLSFAETVLQTIIWLSGSIARLSIVPYRLITLSNTPSTSGSGTTLAEIPPYSTILAPREPTSKADHDDTSEADEHVARAAYMLVRFAGGRTWSRNMTCSFFTISAVRDHTCSTWHGCCSSACCRRLWVIRSYNRPYKWTEKGLWPSRSSIDGHDPGLLFLWGSNIHPSFDGFGHQMIGDRPRNCCATEPTDDSAPSLGID